MNIKQLKNANILVIGDIILDIYYSGIVNRLTPDAPVPVLKMKNQEYFLGGAGNVVQNIKSLSGNVGFIGLSGNDHNSKILSKLLKESYIKAKIFKIPYPTITKINIIGEREEGESQKIVRLDIEEDIKLSADIENEIIIHLESIITNFDSIIISDYSKGMCTKNICQSIIRLANNMSIPVLVDPKGANWNKYKNATLIKPNLNELSEVIGKEIENEDNAIVKHGLKIKNDYNLDYLIITRSKKGGSLISNQGTIHFLPNVDKVVNVIGAGDTFIATLSLCLASKINIEDSIDISNHASGIVTSKKGTASVSIEELEYKVTLKNKIDKLIEICNLLKTITTLRENNKKIVFTNGYFDLIHNGHIELLKKAKQLGDILIVGVNSDESVKLNNKNLANNEENRISLISSIQYVDFVIIFDNDKPDNILKIIKPDVIVKGGNYNNKDIVGKEYAKKAEILPFQKKIDYDKV